MTTTSCKSPPCNNFLCTDDYTYFLQSFCIIDLHNVDPESANNTSYGFAVYFGVEILISIYFIKKATQQARFIKNYNRLNKDDKTYCKFSLMIMSWLRINLICIIVSRLVAMGAMLSGNRFGDWNYQPGSPNKHFIHFSFCEESLFGNIFQNVLGTLL